MCLTHETIPTGRSPIPGVCSSSVTCIELVTTINWASAQTLALQHAYSGVGFDLGAGNLREPLGGQLGMSSGSDVVLSQLKKVAKGERSSDEDALLDLMEMTYYMLCLH